MPLHVLIVGYALAAGPSRDPEALFIRPAVDVPVVVAAAATGTALVVFRPQWGPRSCRWCDTDADGKPQLNELDSAARSALKLADEHIPTARLLGDATGYGVLAVVGTMPHLLTWAVDERKEDAAVDFMIAAESLVVAHAIEQGLKYAIARTRPSMLFRPSLRTGDPDDDMSMVSGHATAGFAVAVSNGMVASLRGSRRSPLVWVSGLAVALTSSYLRMASDRHYLTDVMAGAALGTAVGVVVPLLHRRSSQPDAVEVSVRPVVTGQSLGLTASGSF